MKKILKTSIVLVFFSFALLLFQISCDNDAEANPNITSGITPVNLIFFYKQGASKAELWAANYDGSQPRLVFLPPQNFTFLTEFSISASTDGKKLFMTLNEAISSSNEIQSIYSINLDGTGLTKVIAGTVDNEVALAGVW